MTMLILQSYSFLWFFIQSICIVDSFLLSSSPSHQQQQHQQTTSRRIKMAATTSDNVEADVDDDEVVVDIAIVGAGIGGLCAGAILNAVYGKKVGIYESHYLPGGCAHAFERKSSSSTNNNGGDDMTFTFDSGPTILLGCSKPPFSALRQVLEAVNQNDVDWIRYDGWGMIENPLTSKEKRWKCQLGPDHFQQGPLTQFSVDCDPDKAIEEFEKLREVCKPLIVGASIPAMAMRPGPSALIPLLLKYFPTLLQLIQISNELTGTFDSYINGPNFYVTNVWLRNWLDALAFSLSGLPASRTSAAAMAFVLEDMHKPNAALDYPKGGLGSVITALVKGVESGSNGSKLYLRSHVNSIDFSNSDNPADNIKATGLTLRNGKTIKAKEGVICNAPVWSLSKLIKDDSIAKLILNNNKKEKDLSSYVPPQTWITTTDKEGGSSSIRLNREEEEGNDEDGLLDKCNKAEQTGSFLHLHVAINSTGLDLSQMEAHYTVMDRGLSGDDDSSVGIVNGVKDDGPCGELNMIALSNPCVIDPTLAPPGYMVLHAYGAGNEPYEIWAKQQQQQQQQQQKSNPTPTNNDDEESLSSSKSSLREEYEKLKEERAKVLWRAMESIIPDIRDRVVLDLIGSPLTHERFLRRPRGTYGAATEDYLPDGSTPISNFVLAGDSIFPGIGVPSVAISGASAANAFVNPIQQWFQLDELKKQNKLQV